MPDPMEGTSRGVGRATEATPLGRFGSRGASSMVWTRGGRGRRGSGLSRGRRSTGSNHADHRSPFRGATSTAGSGRGAQAKEKMRWKLGQPMELEGDSDKRDVPSQNVRSRRYEREEGEMMDVNDVQGSKEAWRGPSAFTRERPSAMEKMDQDVSMFPDRRDVGGFGPSDSGTLGMVSKDRQDIRRKSVKEKEQKGKSSLNRVPLGPEDASFQPEITRPDSSTLLQNRAERFAKSLTPAGVQNYAGEQNRVMDGMKSDEGLLEEGERAQEGEEMNRHDIALDDASQRGPVVGTCEDMCPLSERERRERLDDIHFFERVDASDRSRTSKELAVKRFSRQVDNPPPEDVRTRKSLQKTMVHLRRLLGWADVKDADDSTRVSRLATVHKFLWDRYRGVRSDLTVQGIRDAFAIQLLEEMVRFHIMTEHELCEAGEAQIDDHEGFNRHLNVEQLNKCLITLNEFYSDAWMAHKARNNASTSWESGVDVPDACRNEPEFRSYHLMTQLGTHGKYKQNVSQVIRDITSLPPYSLRTPPVVLALELLSLLSIGDFVGYFRKIKQKETPYLAACCAFMVSSSVRSGALKILHSAGRPGELFPISHLQRMLLFDSEEQAAQLCQHHELILASATENGPNDAFLLNRGSFVEPSQSFPLFLSASIQAKRAGKSLAAVIKSPAWDDTGVVHEEPAPEPLKRAKPPHDRSQEFTSTTPITANKNMQVTVATSGQPSQSLSHKRSHFVEPADVLEVQGPILKRQRGPGLADEKVPHQMQQMAETLPAFKMRTTQSHYEGMRIEDAHKQREREQEQRRIQEAEAEYHAFQKARIKLENAAALERKRAEAAESERVRKLHEAEMLARAEARRREEEAERAAAARAAEIAKIRKQEVRTKKCREAILKLRIAQWRRQAKCIVEARRAAARLNASMGACSADPSSSAARKFGLTYQRMAPIFLDDGKLDSIGIVSTTEIWWKPLDLGKLAVPHLLSRGLSIPLNKVPWKLLVSCPDVSKHDFDGSCRHGELDRYVTDWLWSKFGRQLPLRDSNSKQYGVSSHQSISLGVPLPSSSWDALAQSNGARAPGLSGPASRREGPKSHITPIASSSTQVEFYFSAADMQAINLAGSTCNGSCGAVFLMSKAAACGVEEAILRDRSRLREILSFFKLTQQPLPLLIVVPPGAGGDEQFMLWRRRMKTAVVAVLGLQEFSSYPVNIVALPPGLLLEPSCGKLEEGVQWLASEAPVPPAWSILCPYDYVMERLEREVCGSPSEYIQFFNEVIHSLLSLANSSDVRSLESWGWPSDPDVSFFPESDFASGEPSKSSVGERRILLVEVLEKLLLRKTWDELSGTLQQDNFDARSHSNTIDTSEFRSLNGTKRPWHGAIRSLIYARLASLVDVEPVLVVPCCQEQTKASASCVKYYIPSSPVYIKSQFEKSAETHSLLKTAISKVMKGDRSAEVLEKMMPVNLERQFMEETISQKNDHQSISGKQSFGLQPYSEYKIMDGIASSIQEEKNKEREFEDLLVRLASAAPEF